MNETVPKENYSARTEGKQHRSGARRVGYIFSILFMLLFIYILHHLRQWGVNFLTEDFEKCLFYIDLSIYISIAAQVLFIFYDNSWFRHLLKGVTNIASALATIMVYVIYPFDFHDATWNKWIRIGILILFILSVISILVELIKGIRDLIKDPQKV